MCRMLIFACFAVVSAANLACGGEWPQVLGPQRNGVASKESLADSWPEAGPGTLWQLKVGTGLGGVAVRGGKLILFHRVGNDEIVEVVDAGTGKGVWRASFPTTFVPSINPDNGPRTVPVVTATQVIVYGAGGDLHALDFKTGGKLWSRQTHADFETNGGYFGAGSTPIVEGDRVIVNVGGKRTGAGVVAFAADSGKTVWKSVDDNASYSSPVAVTLGKTRHLIIETRQKTLSLDPKTGAVRWELPFGKIGPTVNGASPVVVGDKLFLTASYHIGGLYARFSGTRIETLWTNDELLSSQYTTPIAHDGKLFGVHGRQDQGTSSLRCVDPVSQRVLWSQDDFGYATLIQADGKLLAMKTDGELVMLALDSTKYRELARAKLFDNTTRALPALSNGLLYVRDAGTLKCVDLRKPAK